MGRKIYVSTAIDYVNASPHLGHCFEKVQADIIARYFRLQNYNVFFLTGTDENSLKNVRAAEKENISVEALVDKNANKFYELKKILNLSLDDFIRTTEERNIKGAQKLWLACKKDIYKKIYRGLYCVGCEEFYKEDGLIKGLCPEHKVKPEIVEEENYFFKLSRYQKQLEKILLNNKVQIIPEARRNEVMNFVKSGLQDFCISRSAQRASGWGIDVPGDATQKIWVWFDALSNYINALGYGSGDKKFEEFWQDNGNILHIIGKGILRFHAVYWIGILLSAKLSLPKRIFIHGYITVNRQKMSKSLGNVVDPFALVAKYGTDAVRYYLLREISPTEDGDFTYEKFEQRYNADLAGGIGNLLARTIALARKENFKEKKPTLQIKRTADKAKKDCKVLLLGFKYNEALKAIWDLIGVCDKHLNDKKPWEGGKNASQAISNALFALKEISEMLLPFLPETSERIKKSVAKRQPEILFPRVGLTK